MKNTMELLKQEGLVRKLQKNFNSCKPPVGTPDKTILESIETIIKIHGTIDDDFRDKLFDALFDDMAQHVRNELTIEYVSEEDFAETAKKVACEVIEAIFK